MKHWHFLAASSAFCLVMAAVQHLEWAVGAGLFAFFSIISSASEL